MPNEIYCKTESINLKIELKNFHEYLLKAKWNLIKKMNELYSYKFKAE